MLNLIRRDLIVQKHFLIIYIPMILFFIIMDSHPALTIMVAAILIPFNAFGNDEQANTHLFLNALPYTRLQIIAARYVGALVYMIVSIGITILLFLIFNTSFSLRDILIGSGLFILFAALTFPLYYIVKPGYITHIVLISFIVLAGVGPAITLYLFERLPAILDWFSQFSLTTLYTGAGAIIVVFYLLSWALSSVVYSRKAF